MRYMFGKLFSNGKHAIMKQQLAVVPFMFTYNRVLESLFSHGQQAIMKRYRLAVFVYICICVICDIYSFESLFSHGKQGINI